MARVHLLVVGLFMFALAACGAAPPATAPPGAATVPRGSAFVPLPTNAATAGAAATAGSAVTGAMGEPIPIGVSVAQTSTAAAFGQDEMNGARVAERFFNERGGVNGRPIRLIFEDTGGDEMGAINAFQTQVTRNRVVGIVGPTLSQQGFAAYPLMVQAKVPVLGPSTTAKGIPQIGEYVSRTSAPVTVVAPHSLRYAVSQNPNLKRVAVLYAQNDAYSASETLVFQEAVKAQGLELVTVQKFQTTDTDFTAQITATLAAKPDAVIISGFAADGGNLVRQLRELGYRGSVIGGSGLNTPNILPVCRAQCDGILLAQAYSPALNTEMNTAFKRLYAEMHGTDKPPQFAVQAFVAVQIFTEALRVVEAKTPLRTLSLEQTRTALNTQAHAGSYVTPLGDIAFDGERDIVQKTFYVAQIKMNPDGMTGEFRFLT